MLDFDFLKKAETCWCTTYCFVIPFTQGISSLSCHKLFCGLEPNAVMKSQISTSECLYSEWYCMVGFDLLKKAETCWYTTYCFVIPFTKGISTCLFLLKRRYDHGIYLLLARLIVAIDIRYYHESTSSIRSPDKNSRK